MTVSSRLVKINPTQAEKWLEGNILNRTIKDKHVKYLASQMRLGKWKSNGSTLVFASDGTLLDGQHRLWACIEAKQPFVTLVAEGVDKDSFSTIDTGTNRTPGDVINTAGFKQNSALIAQAATHVINYRTTDLNSFKRRVPRWEVLEFVEASPELLELVTLAKHTKSAVRKHAAVAIAVSYMAGYKHPQPARNFLRKFMTGEELTAKSPILVLQQRLLNETRLRPTDRLALCANAWNAYISGKQVSHLKITGSVFPKIIGAIK